MITMRLLIYTRSGKIILPSIEDVTQNMINILG